MGCGCGGGQSLAPRNNRPLNPDSDLYPFSLEGEEPSLVRGKNEQGELIPFVYDQNQPQAQTYKCNPNGCQFDGRKLNNYGPTDYPAWML